MFLVFAAPAWADHAGPLAGQWHLDSAQGGGPATTDDSSGHGLTGTSTAPMSIETGGRFGNHLGAMNTGVVTAGPSPLLQTNRVTLIAWVRHNGPPPNYRYIAGQGDDGGTCLGSSYALYTGSNENPGLEFFIRPTSGNFRVSPTSSNAIWDGLWHMVAGVYDGESVRLYVDGDQIGPGTPAPGLEINYGFSGSRFYFGGYPVGACGDGDFPGGIDEVRMYGRALSPTEIDRLAEAPGPDPPELVPDDFEPPETTIVSGPADGEIVGDVPPIFAFGANDPNATFECRTYNPDAEGEAFYFFREFRPCTSPHRRLDLFGRVRLGERMIFEVRAVDGAGNVDPSPAVRQYVRHGVFNGKPPRLSECDLVTVKEEHGKVPDGCRLAEIRKGKVGCVHVNSAHVERCEFDKQNNRWIKSWTGREWAVVGDAIGLEEDGKAKYLVAQRIGEKDESPCASPPRKNRDSAGIPSGSELAWTCVVEVMGASWNATGEVLDNYATREVCTSSYPHPDGTDFREGGTWRIKEPGVYCYTGIGAALNNPSGHELDQGGHVLAGSKRCHIVWANGYEIYAAKRPAVRRYPAPAKIDEHSPIVWRPMAEDIRIAN